MCHKSLRVQSVALAESPHAKRILGVKTAENYATGFRAYVRSSEPWALGRNPFGIQRWNFRKAGAQILAALDYKSALRHSSCGQGHLGDCVAERSAGLIRSDLRFQRFHSRVVGLGGG